MAINTDNEFDHIVIKTDDPNQDYGIGGKVFPTAGIDNHVLAFGFNVGDDGQPKDPSLPKWSIQFESHFAQNPGVDEYAEWHVQYMDASQTPTYITRPISMYVNHLTGKSAVSTSGRFDIKGSDNTQRVWVDDNPGGTPAAMHVGSPNNPVILQFEDTSQPMFQAYTPNGKFAYTQGIRVHNSGLVILAPQANAADNDGPKIRFGSAVPSISNVAELMQWLDDMGIINYTP